MGVVNFLHRDLGGGWQMHTRWKGGQPVSNHCVSMHYYLSCVMRKELSVRRFRDSYHFFYGKGHERII